MIEEFNDGTGRRSVPVVAITARMVESNDGRVIWSARSKRRGDDYIIAFEMGRVRSVAALTQRTVQEMIDTIR
jgi:TolB-like protein